VESSDKKHTNKQNGTCHFFLIYELCLKNTSSIFNPYLIIWPNTNWSFYMEIKGLFPCKILTRNYYNKGTSCSGSLLNNPARCYIPWWISFLNNRVLQSLSWLKREKNAGTKWKDWWHRASCPLHGPLGNALGHSNTCHLGPVFVCVCVCVELELELRDLHLVGRHSTTWSKLQSFLF
jgi:hypothetical protein